jgi:site-specific DNA-methyltransferase (adenine-specific)
MKIDLRLGDCLEVLKTIPDNSIDSVVTDPPYHLTTNTSSSKGFMGKEWDGGDIAFRTEVWSECLRVLKPGGHLLAFSHSRTYHRMAVAVEDAGFEIRDQIMWIYGSGFPKSHNIGKAIDKIEGNEREVVGRKIQRVDGTTRNLQPNGGFMKENVKTKPSDGYIDVEKPGSENSERWEGWGTALKPSHEPIVMARKPLTEKSIAENVLKYGTGGINIDGSRIGFRDEADKESAKPGSLNATGEHSMFGLKSGNELNDGGRFPANIIFDEEAGQLLDEQSGKSKTKANKNYKHSNTETESNTFTGRGTYTPREDEGGASRFFYCPKTSKSDRNEGLIVEKEKNKRPIGVAFNNEDDLFQQGTGNNHPTVKPVLLMRYLINLITPPNGTTLDPFMGSGSTGKAAVRCGVNFIGIEKEQEYMDIASARIQHEQNKPLQQSLF